MSIIQLVNCWITRKGGAMVLVVPMEIREKFGIKKINSKFLKTQDLTIKYLVA